MLIPYLPVRRPRYVTPVALILATASSLVGQITPISLTLLDVPAGALTTSANAVNESGQVAGLATFGSGVQHALLYSAGATTDLGTLGVGVSSSGLAINNNGAVGGYSTFLASPSTVQHAVVYSGGSLQDLNPSGANSSQVFGINDAGQIVGGEFIPGTGNGNRAFLRTGTTVTNLGTLGGTSSRATAINNLGVVVGEASLAGTSPTHAFVYSSGVMTDLGTLGGASSSGRAINDLGQIAGTSMNAANQSRAFLYSSGSMADLGTLGGTSGTIGHGINDFGQVVGISTLANNAQRAFIYSNGTMYNLQDVFAPLMSNGSTVGFTSLIVAMDISDSGWIVGTGSYFNGTTTNGTRAFVARIEAPAVPDGGGTLSFLLLSIASLVTGRLGRRRT
jgi:probable HAF family extracellular repeat protein